MSAMREHDARAYAGARREHAAPAYATHGRTHGRTDAEVLRNAQSLSNASRAGGQNDLLPRDLARTLTDDEVLAWMEQHKSKRAAVIRSGTREPISPLVRQLVYRRDRWACQMCHAVPFARSADRKSGALHLDHIVPWSAGGSDRSDNLRTLCGPCNVRRSNFVSSDDRPSRPVVRICAPCLSETHRGIAALCANPAGTFPVYCGSRSHISWALPGWRIL